MVQFQSGYVSSMEREFQEQPVTPLEPVNFDIEKPIIPISEIGTTSPDSVGGNILQNLERNINMGTKKIQIVFTPGRGGGVSTGPSSYGKEVRKSLKEKAQATGVDIIGVELSPAMISGLAGFNQRSGQISEEQRQTDMNQVKDAIRFAADVSGGGCVDIWSQEFQRQIFDADWNKDKGTGKKVFYDHSPDELKKDVKDLNLTKYLIDKRTGAPMRGSDVRTNDKIYRIKYKTAKDFGMTGKKDASGTRMLKEDDYVDAEGNYVSKYDDEAFMKLVPKIDDKKKDFEIETANWDTIVKEAKEYSQEHAKELGGRELKPEEYFYRQKLATEAARTRGTALYYGRDVDEMYGQLNELTKNREMLRAMEAKMTMEQKQEWIRDNVLKQKGVSVSEEAAYLQKNPSDIVTERITRLSNQIHAHQEQAISARQSFEEIKDVVSSISTPENFAKGKTFESYAELGIDAMNVTKERKLDKAIYVGPELGWAGQSYGGHPEEFIEIVEQSRKKMAEKLIAQGYKEDSAKEAAKNHIKGMMDTSHLAMWFKHYAKKDDETDEKHLKRFNEWTKEQVKKMVEKGVVGGVQVVDSITGEHAHLPAGQGSFDVVGMVHAMKNAGFKGPIISEGHEEDTGGFGQGRILTETWRAFGSPIGQYSASQPAGIKSWGGMQNSYFGRTMPTNYIVGAYSPSNDWSLWSEMPFE